MKTVIFLICLLIAAGAMAQSFQSRNIQLAAAGCCKEQTGKGWRIISRDLSRCQELNSRFDNGDDIFSPINRFWWDSSCK